MDPGRELEKAIFDKLSADTNITVTEGAQVFSGAPPGTATPYVDIASVDAIEADTKTETLREFTVVLNVWAPDRLKVTKIRPHIETDMQALAALQNNTLVNIRLTSSDVIRDIDERHHNGVMRFRAVVQS